MDIVKYVSRREQTQPAIITYSLYLYFSSRIYRFAYKSLEPIIKRTNVSIWKRVQKYSRLADRFKVNIHLIKEILVHETLLKINGRAYYWLWIAYDPNTKSCLMIHLSRQRIIFVYYQFLRQPRRRYD
jgi:transposase-like protein